MSQKSSKSNYKWPFTTVHIGLAITLIMHCQMQYMVQASDIVKIKVFPSKLQLTDFNPKQKIIIQGFDQYQNSFDLASTIKPEDFAYDKNLPVTIDRDKQGRITFTSQTGEAESQIILSYQKHKLTIPIHIRKKAGRPKTSYRLDVYPIFMRSGCNSGDCHGAARGKDGFNLSLFGYDPKGDHYRLTSEEPFRRISRSLPQESLLLLKAIGEVPHTGGESFTADSPHYQTMLNWLLEGAHDDTDKAPKPMSLTLYPPGSTMKKPSLNQTFIAMATYENGAVRDVTDLSVFMSSNKHCAQITPEGVLKAQHRGEAFIMARFDKFTVGSEAIVAPEEDHFAWKAPQPANFIDEAVYAKLRKLRVNPTSTADDRTFLRRATLDIAGRLPTETEISAFTRNQNPDKREQVISALIDEPGFNDLWSQKFAELLKIRSANNNNALSPKQARLLHTWVRDQISANQPINEMVREIIAAEGSAFKSPTVVFYRTENDKLKLAENIAQSFLGMRLQCAKCHNHPFDRWTMDDYYGFASFFTQIGYKKGKDPRDAIIYNRGSGEVKHPVTRKNAEPQFLGGKTIDIPKGKDRRHVAADWITSKDNPYFGRHMANMIWRHFFATGIIEPYDDVRISNPPANKVLLSALTESFIDSGFNLRALVKTISMSNTYQAATKARYDWSGETKYFSSMVPRRLSAEVLQDAVSDITNTTLTYKAMPRGAKAISLHDGTQSNYFLNVFGRNPRLSVCSCDTSLSPTLSQSLHLINSNSIYNMIQRSRIVSGQADHIYKSTVKQNLTIDMLEAALGHIYKATLSRKPSTHESDHLIKILNIEAYNSLKPNDKKKAISEWLTDVSWAIFNSKEFIFNH